MARDGVQRKRYAGLQKVWGTRPKTPSPLAEQQGRDYCFLKLVRSDESVFRDVIRRFQAGEPVDNILLKAHYPMLLKITTRAVGRQFSEEIPDMLQSARMGMLEACARFDLTNPESSVGYVWMYVRHYVYRDLLSQGTVVRIPLNKYKLKRDPDDENPKFNTKKNHVIPFSEMGEKHHEEDHLAFEEVLVSEAPQPDELVDLAWRSDVLQNIIKHVGLSTKESHILKERMLGKTLGEVGDALDLSREGIRQIEKKALNKLRHKALARKGEK